MTTLPLTDQNIALVLTMAKAAARRDDSTKIDVHFLIAALTELQQRRRRARVDAGLERDA